MNAYDPQDPAGQLKRSLKRAGLMILIMVLMAAVIMGYITYQFNTQFREEPHAVIKPFDPKHPDLTP